MTAGKLYTGAWILIFILGGLGTWLLWDFAYRSEDHVVPNSRAFEKAVWAKHPDVTFCSLVEVNSVLFDVLLGMFRAEKAVYFAASPEEFANSFNGKFANPFTGNECVVVGPYLGSRSVGQELYLGETGSGKFVAWHETYALPQWTLKTVSDETITYNRNNGAWIGGGIAALWGLLITAIAYFHVFHHVFHGDRSLNRNKPAAP